MHDDHASIRYQPRLLFREPNAVGEGYTGAQDSQILQMTHHRLPVHPSARFRLEGDVVEFQENDMPDVWKASLNVNITLLDTDQENIADKVVFQRSYRTLEPMLTKTPQGLAEAMSVAMQKVAQQIIDDVYRAVKQRLGKGTG